MIIGTINVDEFITVDGVIDSPTWSFDYPFEEKMGAAIGRITAVSQAILLGRTTYEQFAPAWSSRTAEDDPGAPFFNDTPKYVVPSTKFTLAESETYDSGVLHLNYAPTVAGAV
jgi:hypothetical protein